ncbi:response regulator [Devosia sp.]|uniref:response regulator n=1 Tax=Devosia sp. TaxID=1871048 RepID=UPI003BAD9F6E
MRTRSVAMLAANPAFADILCRTLEQLGGYRVATFTGIEALTTFLRISPVDVVVLDTDLPGAPAADIARGLRNHMRLASDAFEIVALTRAAEPFHRPLLAAGIDAVLTKPVSAPQLLMCIDTILAEARGAMPEPRHMPSERSLVRVAATPAPAPARAGNVIPLFGEGRQRP